LIPKAKKGTKSDLLGWEFDAKDGNCQKYGNLSTPTLMKLVSKYNKTHKENPLVPEKVSALVEEELN